MKLKYLFCFVFSILTVGSSYGQFSRSEDTAIGTKSMFDSDIGINRDVEYFKHYLTVKLDTLRMNDTMYLNNVWDNIHNNNAIITNIYLDTTNQLDAMSFFNSKGFSITTVDSTRFSVYPVEDWSNLRGFFIIRLTDTSDAYDQIPLFENSKLYRYVESAPVPRLQVTDPPLPNDAGWQYQWYLKQSSDHDVDGEKAWWITKGNSSNSRIFIIDTGIRLNGSLNLDHQDLSTSNITKGINYSSVGSSQDITDNEGHGTQIAGLIVSTQNSVGISGLDPKSGITIHKVMDQYSSALEVARMVSAINNVISFKNSNFGTGVVINISLRWTQDHEEIRTALNNANLANIMVICASGNDGGIVTYPARYTYEIPNVISVGATDPDDNWATYSNYSTESIKLLDLVAPGGEGGNSTWYYDNIYTTDNLSSSSYTVVSGTSLAAPLVTATVGLMYSVKNTLSVSAVRDKLILGCDKVTGMNGNNWHYHYGYGRLNTYKSVILAMDSVNSVHLNSSNFQNFTRLYGNCYVDANTTIYQSTGKSVVLTSGAHLELQSNGTHYAEIHFEGAGTNFIQQPQSMVTGNGELIVRNGAYYINDNGNLDLYAGFYTGCLALLEGGSLIIPDDVDMTLEDGGFMGVNDGSSIYIGDNSKLTFAGQSFTNWFGGGHVYLGNNSSIHFRENAYINARSYDTSHIWVQGYNGATWDGIYLDSNSSIDSIKNCVFSNSSVPLNISNNPGSSAYSEQIINNKINEGSLKIANGNDLLIQGNVFNSPNSSNKLLDIFYSFSARKLPKVNIVGNSLVGGQYGIRIAGFAGNMIPLYIFGNTFTGANSNVRIGFWGNNVSGSFKDNTFNDNNYSIGYDILNSSMDLYGNNIKSNFNPSIWIASNSISNMAPVTDLSGHLVWTGGGNKITTANNDVITFQNGSNCFLNLGQNCLNENNTSYYHLNGSYPGPCFNPYIYATKNSWNFIPPNINLTCNGNGVYVEYTPYLTSCPISPAENLDNIGTQLTDMGDGILDTTVITNNFGGGIGGGQRTENKIINDIAPDISAYYELLENMRIRDFGLSAAKCRYIIDNYDTSKYVTSSINNLFINYQSLDTNNQTRQLFTGLASYLADKITQYQNNISILDKLYWYYLKSLVKIGNYSEAITGYENIINNHPDPVIRMTASWERASVELLLNGSGGSENEFLISDDDIKDKNPVINSMRNNYKVYASFYKSSETMNKVNKKISKFSVASTKELYLKIENDVNTLLLATKNKKNNISNLPEVYSLSQNYPNPFNPYTLIKYALPNDVTVNIKVYDLIGREVTTLVNDFKKAGYYEMRFDGSNLSSGIYFYRIEAGNFIQTKKMVLIK